MFVDGYNILGAWPEFVRGRDIAAARDALIDALHHYAGYTQQQVTVVFDAWRSDRAARSVESVGALQVVYTKKGETADRYIERLCHEQARAVQMGWAEVRVATSDLVEQTIAMGRGAIRVSARELIAEMGTMQTHVRAQTGRPVKPVKSTVMEQLPDEIRRKLEKMRRGET